MPLSSLQSEILLLLAANRSPESYVAGATALNRNGPRYSNDIDVFHDDESAVSAAAHADANALIAMKFEIAWRQRGEFFLVADVMKRGEKTRLEWAGDSSFRFFPTQRDDLFGYILHPVDIATNKALAAGGRRVPRDILDLLYIHDEYLPLGAVIWAAVGKDPGFSPEKLISEIRRTARYQPSDYENIATAEPVDAGAVSRRLKQLLTEAEEFVWAMPAGKEGRLFLENGRAVQPDPNRLDRYIEHVGKPSGHWPSSPDISSAMLHRPRGPGE